VSGGDLPQRRLSIEAPWIQIDSLPDGVWIERVNRAE